MSSKTDNYNSVYKKEYRILGGIDKNGDEAAVNVARAPYMVNMWRDYGADNHDAIETVPGFRVLREFSTPSDSRIYGIHKGHIGDIGDGDGWDAYIVHVGSNLCVFKEDKLDSLTASDITTLSSIMSAAKSQTFCLGGHMFIMDGTHIYQLYTYSSSTYLSYRDWASFASDCLPIVRYNDTEYMQHNLNLFGFRQVWNRPSYTECVNNYGLHFSEYDSTNHYYEVTGIDPLRSYVYVPSEIVVNGETRQVKKIGDEAFINNTTIKQVVVARDVEYIGSRVFYGCTNLKTVVLHGIRTIGTNAFMSSGLESLFVSDRFTSCSGSLPSDFCSDGKLYYYNVSSLTHFQSLGFNGTGYSCESYEMTVGETVETEVAIASYPRLSFPEYLTDTVHYEDTGSSYYAFKADKYGSLAVAKCTVSSGTTSQYVAFTVKDENGFVISEDPIKSYALDIDPSANNAVTFKMGDNDTEIHSMRNYVSGDYIFYEVSYDYMETLTVDTSALDGVTIDLPDYVRSNYTTVTHTPFEGYAHYRGMYNPTSSTAADGGSRQKGDLFVAQTAGSVTSNLPDGTSSLPTFLISKGNAFYYNGSSYVYLPYTCVQKRAILTCKPSVIDSVKLTLECLNTDLSMKRTTYENDFRKATGYDGALVTAVKQCTVFTVFDGRLFMTGNPNLPNTVFFSSFNADGFADPTYFGILNYVNVGSSDRKNIAFLNVYGNLAVLKEKSDSGEAAVYLLNGKDTGDHLVPRTYSVESGVSDIGCIADSGALRFMDDPVFLSERGLDSVSSRSIGYERKILHRSKFIDNLLNKDTSLSSASLAVWEGYLVILTEGKMYLADSRALSSDDGYEWYYLEGIGGYSADRESFHKVSTYDIYPGWTPTTLYEDDDNDGTLTVTSSFRDNYKIWDEEESGEELSFDECGSVYKASEMFTPAAEYREDTVYYYVPPMFEDRTVYYYQASSSSTKYILVYDTATGKYKKADHDLFSDYYPRYEFMNYAAQGYGFYGSSESGDELTDAELAYVHSAVQRLYYVESKTVYYYYNPSSSDTTKWILGYNSTTGKYYKAAESNYHGCYQGYDLIQPEYLGYSLYPEAQKGEEIPTSELSYVHSESAKMFYKLNQKYVTVPYASGYKMVHSTTSTAYKSYYGDWLIYNTSPYSFWTSAEDGVLLSDDRKNYVYTDTYVKFVKTRTPTGLWVYYYQANPTAGTDKYLVNSFGEYTGGTFKPAVCMLAVGKRLLFGTTGGHLCVFNNDKRGESVINNDYEETVKEGTIHHDYYTFASHRYHCGFSTCFDDCNVPHLAKNTERNSLIIRTKGNSPMKFTIKCRTDREPWETLDEIAGGDNDMSAVYYDAETFKVTDSLDIAVREHKRRWIRKQYYLATDCFKNPFGVYSVVYRWRVKGRILPKDL